MAVTLYTDRRMLEHRVPGRHPERPERLQAILRHLERTGYSNTCPSGLVREATSEELLRVHESGYLREIEAARGAGRRICRPRYLGFPAFDAGGPAGGRRGHRGGLVCDERPRPACSLPGPSAGTSCPSWRRHGLLHLRQCRAGGRRGPRTVRAQPRPDRRFRRPPRQRHAGDLLRLGAGRVSLDPSLSRSIPAPARKDETGTGPGLGYTLNIPLPYGTPRAEYHAAFRAGLQTLADRVKPELVLISAASTPTPRTRWATSDWRSRISRRITREIVAVAETHAQGRIVSVLEGGYNVPILAGCVAAHLHALGRRAGYATLTPRRLHATASSK